MTSPKARGLRDSDPLARPRRTPSPISVEPEDTGTDAAVDRAAADTPAPAAAVAAQAQARPKSSSRSDGKTKMTIYVDDDVLSDAKDAFIALAATGPRSLSEFATQALRNEVDRLAAEHNKGKSFPRRRTEPRAGRPVT